MGYPHTSGSLTWSHWSENTHTPNKTTSIRVLVRYETWKKDTFPYFRVPCSLSMIIFNIPKLFSLSLAHRFLSPYPIYPHSFNLPHPLFHVTQFLTLFPSLIPYPISIPTFPCPLYHISTLFLSPFIYISFIHSFIHSSSVRVLSWSGLRWIWNLSQEH